MPNAASSFSASPSLTPASADTGASRISSREVAGPQQGYLSWPGPLGTFAWVTGDSDGSRSSGPWYASDPPTAPFEAVGSGRDQGPAGFERLSGLSGQPPRRGHRARSSGSRKRRPAIIAGIVAVVAGIAAAVVFVVLPSSPTHTTGFVPTGSTPAQDAQEITAAFLKAWKAGDLDTAARLTDHRSEEHTSEL